MTPWTHPNDEAIDLADRVRVLEDPTLLEVSLADHVMRLLCEIGYAGSPPPGGSWAQRQNLIASIAVNMSRLVKELNNAS